jgi:hypothetical protein
VRNVDVTSPPTTARAIGAPTTPPAPLPHPPGPLPKQLAREEIEKIAREVILEVGATSPKDTGSVMKALMPRVKGQADGKLVSVVVQDLLRP